MLLLFWPDNLAPDRLHNNSMGTYKDFIGNKVPRTYFLHIPDGLSSVWVLFNQWRLHRMGTFFAEPSFQVFIYTRALMLCLGKFS